MYGDDKVIKISLLSFFGGKKLHDKLNHDYAVCKKYLPSFVVETMDISLLGGNKHIEMQDFMQRR